MLQEKYEDAIQDSTRALELNPKLVPALIGLGTAYYEKKRSFGQAETYYRKAAETASSPELYNDLGNSPLYQGHYNEAINQFQSALKLDPNFAAGYRNLGIAYYYLGNTSDAIAAEQKAISINPHVPDAYFFLAQSYDKSRNYAHIGDIGNYHLL